MFGLKIIKQTEYDSIMKRSSECEKEMKELSKKNQRLVRDCESLRGQLNAEIKKNSQVPADSEKEKGVNRFPRRKTSATKPNPKI